MKRHTAAGRSGARDILGEGLKTEARLTIGDGASLSHGTSATTISYTRSINPLRIRAA